MFHLRYRHIVACMHRTAREPLARTSPYEAIPEMRFQTVGRPIARRTALRGRRTILQRKGQRRTENGALPAEKSAPEGSKIHAEGFSAKTTTRKTR